MNARITAPEEFIFCTRLHLSELTGLRASTLNQLLHLLQKVPGSSIYHHTHRFLQQHQYLSPEPPNDFAFWVTEILGEGELGEQLASIDTVQFSNIRALRECIIETIEQHIKAHQFAQLKFAKEGEEFHFIKSVSFVVPTAHKASTLEDFSAILKKITVDSIYFHVFESRLRLEKKTNDFSFWLETSLHEKKLADEIARLDPYNQTLEDLRMNIIRIIERGSGRNNG